jgi:hypothetical protein
MIDWRWLMIDGILIYRQGDGKMGSEVNRVMVSMVNW